VEGTPRAQEPPVGRLRKFLAILFTLAFAAAAAGALAAAYALWRLPSLQSLPARVHAELGAQGGRWVPLSAVAPGLVTALVDTEDQTFWTNAGISVEGIARSVLVDISSGRFVEGGSTLTQQLVRDQLLSQRKSLRRKIEEMVLAVALARLDSKAEILALYLNQVYFGHGAYGVYQASETYFGRRPARLTLAQCTLLAGLPQAPSYLDPLRNPAAARARQAEVVGAMEARGDLTRAAGRAVLAAAWGLR